MNTEDRAQLDLFLRRLNLLEASFSELRSEFQDFTARLDAPESAVTPPPVPPQAMPPIPEYYFPPPPVAPAPEAEPTPVAPVPVASAPEGPGFEIQFGRWLARIGVVFAVLTLIFFSLLAYDRLHQYIGPWTKLGVLALVSSALIGVGLRLERSLLVYGRTLAGGGLACLYYTIYGATYVEPLRVITSPLLGGVLLLAWSAAVLVLAERRKSELLSIFAISLAYFSSAITPVGEFTMAANLLLAVTAIVFLVRNAWTGLSFLCLVGTYLGFVRQLFAPAPDWEIMGAGVDFAHNLNFVPSAVYLTGAWVIFTTGVFLARGTSFKATKRLTFLSLNNCAGAGLLVLAVEATHHGHLGATLVLAGAALLATWQLARFVSAVGEEIADAYLLQGLTVVTAGLVIAYHGVTRGLILTFESVLLAVLASRARSLIPRVGAALVGLAGTAFLLAETIDRSPFPWWLMAAGVAAMLANAWLERRAAGESRTFVAASAFYIVLAQALMARWIYGECYRDEITLIFLALATVGMLVGLIRNSGGLLRAAWLFDLVGLGNYVISQLPDSPLGFTWLDASAFAMLVAQPVLLRRLGPAPVSRWETAAVAIGSSLAAWWFVSNAVTQSHAEQLTLGWAVLALGLVLIGFFSGERFQRWCGLAILAAAFARVAFHDFWTFSDGGKVLTFLVLTVACLGLSFVYYKFSDRLKRWL